MGLLAPAQTRLLTATAVLVGGTVCGGYSGFIAGFGEIAASVAGGIVPDDMLAQYLNRTAVRLRGSQDKLGNHDLTEVTGFAIALIIKSIAEAGTYPHSTKKLTTLAKYTLKAWQEVAEALKEGEKVNFDPIQETELTELFRGNTREYVTQTVLRAEDWQILLKHWLCPGAKVQLPENVVQEVAAQLREKFAFALREVLKGDFAEGGRAFAGLTLSLLGEMQGILQELLNTSSQTQTQDLQAELAAVRQLREELGADSQRFQVWGNQIQSGFGEVLRELGLTRGTLAEMRTELQQELRSLQETLTEGLGHLSLQNQQLQDTVETGFEEGFASLNQQNQDLQETLETGFERVVAFFERDTSGVQAISFSLDTNPPKVSNWQGREEELKRVNRWLDDENTKLGVIVGLPGMGKSTLAAKLFRERTDFEDKLWLDLGQRPSYSLVARGILQQLGKLSPQDLEDIPETRLTEVLVHCLQRRRFLLVLDNLESVLSDEGYREVLQRWLGACHQTEILVTTQVAPKLVQENPTELALGGLSAREGAQLLRELAVGGTEADLQEFVNQVNGHPLMLKLVAGLLHEELGEEVTIGQLAGLGIADVGLLMSRLRGYHRQEVVQLVAVLDASFNRLSEKWRRLLLSLVVLRQAFDGTVASAMIGETVAEKELRGLAKRGFLLAEAQGYRFLPFIAEYLKFRLGDLQEAHLGAIRFYESRIKPRVEWERLEDVQEYLEVFYHRCELGEYEAAFDVIWDGNNVSNFLDLRGNNQVLAELYQQLVENLPRREDWRYIASLTSLGNAYKSLRRYPEAIACHKQSLDIKRDIGNRGSEAASLCNLGHACNALGRYEEAIAFYKQSLQISQETGHQRWNANSLIGLGNACDALGRYEEAIAFHQQALDIQRDIGDRQCEAASLMGLGNAYDALGRYEEAIAFHEQSLDIKRDIGNRQGEAASLNNLGNAYNALGRYPEAIAVYGQSLDIQRDIGDRGGEAASLCNLGNAHNALGRYQEAIDVLEQSLQVSQEIGHQPWKANSLIGLGNAYKALGRYPEAIAVHEQALDIKRDIGDRKGEADTLMNLGNSYHKVGRIQEGFATSQQATAIYQDLNLPLDAYPIPNWLKKLAKFAQRGKFHLILCFLGGLMALPFALIGLISVILYRLIRQRFNPR
ncbi:MAG: tetratricopeptide repeat protein [Phormidium sp. BM_Day4_Bin.17]|nr:tetratricopeptide repeat protein [Phormidium sp. BM_Day4_Bin.17]UCJ10925.1 MAG: tetratricopeptide repeat protein [Phormidium sp. PBR-2020]